MCMFVCVCLRASQDSPRDFGAVQIIYLLTYLSVTEWVGIKLELFVFSVWGKLPLSSSQMYSDGTVRQILVLQFVVFDLICGDM